MVENLVMTNLSFDIEKLRNRLEQLPTRHVLTFGVWLLERMLPNFVRFCVETQSEGVWVLKGVISYTWSVIETGKTNQLNPPTLTMCESITPDTEDFDSRYTSDALNAAASASYLLSFIHSNDLAHVLEIAGLARDSAYLYIDLSDDVDDNLGDLEEQIRVHPLMQAELRCQESDLAFLEQWRNDNEKFFGAVLSRSLVELRDGGLP